MHVTLVNVHVKQDHINDFIAATADNHAASIQEPGNLRFDILQQEENSQFFTLYEAYEDADAAAAHKQTRHYLNWRDTVADWMASPRKGVLHKGLYPESGSQWKTGC